MLHRLHPPQIKISFLTWFSSFTCFCHSSSARSGSCLGGTAIRGTFWDDRIVAPPKDGTGSRWVSLQLDIMKSVWKFAPDFTHAIVIRLLYTIVWLGVDVVQKNKHAPSGNRAAVIQSHNWHRVCWYGKPSFVRLQLIRMEIWKMLFRGE
jgi:hypothetical protein